MQWERLNHSHRWGAESKERNSGGRAMKHFSTEGWIDFVNHIVTSDQQQAMQGHLATGCKRCKETVSLWQKVSKTAAADAGARSVVIGTRQMLYRADPYQIDIQIEPKPGTNRLVVTGQLLDLSNPGVIGRDIHVTLSN